VAIIEEILKEDDLYKLLGCKKSSKPEEIRRGFLNRSRSCHPE
jgi:curved DNA-binding protein CbpA